MISRLDKGGLPDPNTFHGNDAMELDFLSPEAKKQGGPLNFLKLEAITPPDSRVQNLQPGNLNLKTELFQP